LDGVEQGELSGISCSSVRSASGRSLLHTIMGLGLLLVFRRKD
jgi:hypothetical protein